jgi:2'-5' RNA ligase
LRIEQNESLQQFQSELKMFCKRELKLVDELSDRNYHPHLTVAFKDMKSNRFPEVLQLVKEQAFESEFLVNHFYILKRNNGYWKVFEKISFGKNL